MLHAHSMHTVRTNVCLQCRQQKISVRPGLKPVAADRRCPTVQASTRTVQKAGKKPSQKSMNDPEVHYLVKQLQGRLTAAVKAEEDSRRESLQSLYRRGKLKQLKREGVVLTDLVPERDGWLFNEAVVKLSHHEGKNLPTNKFSKATDIVATIHLADGHQSTSKDFYPVQGVVVESSQKVIKVALSVQAAEALRGAYLKHSAPSNRWAQNDSYDSGSESADLTDSSDTESDGEGLGSGSLMQRNGRKNRGGNAGQNSRKMGGRGTCGVRLDMFSKSAVAERQLECLGKLGDVQDPSNEAEVRARMIMLNHPASLSLARHPNRWAADPSWRAAAKQALNSLYRKKRLNKSQATAIASSITRSFSIWQGPPGTGKTNTLVGLMQVLITASERSMQGKKGMGTLLVCGETNACADNLAAGALEAGLSVARVGSPARVRADLQHLCLEALAEASPTGERARRLREQAEVLSAQVLQAEQALALENSQTISGGVRQSAATGASSAPTPAVIRGMQNRLRGLRAQSDALLRDAAGRILQNVQVVACTCAVAGGGLLRDLATFKVAIIDEATQATEASTLLPLMKGAECVVLAGDPMQLPPTVISSKATSLGLDKTLFDRLLENGIQADLLAVQYRMHAAICDFPNRWFYGGRVATGIPEKSRPPPRGLKWPPPRTVALDNGEPKWSASPVVLVDASRGSEALGKSPAASLASSLSSWGKGEADSNVPANLGAQNGQNGAKRDQGGSGTSYRNDVEVELAIRATLALCAVAEMKGAVYDWGDVTDIAILSPYSAQVAAIQAALTKRESLISTIAPLVTLSVSSVDAYQGREADAVIFSATRNNPSGKLGFLKDARRLNVAITRPRRALVVIAAPDMLQGDENWGRWLSWCNKFGAVVPEKWLPVAPWEVQDRRRLRK